MAQVNVEIPQLGIHFQGAASLDVVCAWLDSQGVALDPGTPVATPQRTAANVTLRLRVNNPNDVAGVINTISWTPGQFLQDPVVGLPLDLPANGHVDLSVVIPFDGTQAKDDVTTLDGSAVAEIGS